MKKNKGKNTTYSGDSIASKWLSGTWLGNLLGYGNNSYTDGYGTTRNYPDLKESAQGQQLDRMADTAKGAGKLILTGAAFLNPITAGSTTASLLGTGAQAYFITDGLRDAYTRFMNPNKTAGDAVWTGLDLMGATPAIGSLYRNGRSLFPEIKKSLDTQARITARQYADYQPTSVLTKVGKGEHTKPFNYLWDDNIKTSDKYTKYYEDAVTQGLVDSYNILHNPKVLDAIDKNAQAIQGTRAIKIAEPATSYLDFPLWPGDIKFKTTDPGIKATTVLGYNDGLQRVVFTPQTLRNQIFTHMEFDPNQFTANQGRAIASHEGIHAKSIGLGNPRIVGQHVQNILGNSGWDKVKDVYPWKFQEIAPYNLANFSKFNGIKLGQKPPKNQKEWNEFWTKLQTFNSEEIGANSYKNFINPIISYRNELLKANNTEALQKQQESLWKLFNGTGY